MTVFEKCRFSRKVSKIRFHIPLFGIVLIINDIGVYIKKFKNYSTDFQAVTYPTLIACKSISYVNFVDMKIFYTKRPNYKILLYFLCINKLQENPTFRTIRSRPPDRLEQQAARSTGTAGRPIDWNSRPPLRPQQAARSTGTAGRGSIYNRYVNFCKKVVEKFARLKTFL